MDTISDYRYTCPPLECQFLSSASSKSLANQNSNLASFNAKSLVARFDKTESMLLQITDAVQANREPGESNTKFDSGTVGG